jgi:hypothetical protein
MNPKKITFKFREELTRKGETIYRPIAEVFIKGKKGEWFQFYPYVDSGADISLFPCADCELLGFKLRSGEPFAIGGVTGHTLRAYLHRLKIRVGGEDFEFDIGFADSDRIPRLLGRKDILHYFTICLDGKQNESCFIKDY